MDQENHIPLRQIIESLLLASAKPLSTKQIVNLLKTEVSSKKDVECILETLVLECENKVMELKEVASGWRYQIKPMYTQWINKLNEEKQPKYSRAFLETLALVVYRQPITRGEIEQIRGVSVSSNIIRALEEREWIRVVGHKEVPGRPAMYATTRHFMDYFNLKNFSELPPLLDIKEELDNSPIEGVRGTSSGIPNCTEESMAPKNEGIMNIDFNLVKEESLQHSSHIDTFFKELDSLEANIKTTFDASLNKDNKEKLETADFENEGKL